MPESETSSQKWSTCHEEFSFINEKFKMMELTSQGLALINE